MRGAQRRRPVFRSRSKPDNYPLSHWPRSAPPDQYGHGSGCNTLQAWVRFYILDEKEGIEILPTATKDEKIEILLTQLQYSED